VAVSKERLTVSLLAVHLSGQQSGPPPGTHTVMVVTGPAGGPPLHPTPS
jgi:hypothetical protein